MRFGDEKWMIVADTFAASIGAKTWLRGLRLLADATASRSGQSIALAQDNTAPFNHVSEFDPAWVKVFPDDGSADPAVNPFVGAGTECVWGAIVSSGEFLSREKLRRNQFYRDVLVPDDLPDICLSPLLKEKKHLSALPLYDHEKWER